MLKQFLNPCGHKAKSWYKVRHGLPWWLRQYRICNAGDLVQSLGGEDPLEKGMATHSSILAWRIPWTEEPGGLQSVGPQDQTQLGIHTYTILINLPTRWTMPSRKFFSPGQVYVCFLSSYIPEIFLPFS